MLVRIVDDKWLSIEQISTAEDNVLEKEFSVKHPRHQYLDTSFGGYFDGIIRKYDKRKHILARPFLRELRRVCTVHGMPMDVVDDRPPPKYPAPDPSIVTPDLLYGITLDDHQIGAIKSTCADEVGILSCCTGGGKTEYMAGIAKIFNCPTVILCDMTTVVDQIKDRLQLRKVVEEVGAFYAGKRPNGQMIVVGSIQSLIKTSKPDKKKTDTPESYLKKIQAYKTRVKNASWLREVIGKCDLLMVDECDQATSAQWRKLFFQWFNGRRRYGFSGTPFDEDRPIENLVLKEHLGTIIHKTERAYLESINRIIPIRYTAIAFGDVKTTDKTAFDVAVSEAMITNTKFHSIIKKLVEKCATDPDHGVLILVESIPLGHALEALIPNSKFICGDNGMPERRQAIADFESRKVNCLIGGKIVRRGLDLKGGCETLIIATGGKLASGFLQKIGRAVRRNKRGYSQIYDFFFLCNHYLYLHSRKRLKAITNAGYEAKVVFKNGTVEANAFIKSKFRRPK